MMEHYAPGNLRLAVTLSILIMFSLSWDNVQSRDNVQTYTIYI